MATAAAGHHRAPGRELGGGTHSIAGQGREAALDDSNGGVDTLRGSGGDIGGSRSKQRTHGAVTAAAELRFGGSDT